MATAARPISPPRPQPQNSASTTLPGLPVQSALKFRAIEWLPSRVVTAMDVEP